MKVRLDAVPRLQQPRAVQPGRLSELLKKPIVQLALVAAVAYVAGVILRIHYVLHVQRPEDFVYADMRLYTELAQRLATSSEPLMPWDVTHPLGYPLFLTLMRGADGSLVSAVRVQLFMSCLIPLAVGLLGWKTFGKRTGLAAVVFASFYFPFIEYGGYYLSEIPFILMLTLAFVAFFAARDTKRLGVSLGLAAVGGFTLSLAMAFKSVALLAALAFFAADALAILLARRLDEPTLLARLRRLRPWLLRGAVTAVAAVPLLVPLARVCTRANDGRFCVTGNKVGSDFLLGHYGRIADIAWGLESGHGFMFGSPSSWLRHYDLHEKVPFPMTDSAQNTAEAWKWIFAHPFEAVVLSLDHLYDTFFGMTIWPTFNGPRWAYAQLSQYVFIMLLFVPTVLVCARVLKGGARAALTSRTALVLAPVAAIAFTVAIATGEVRYRIPFDIFFIVTACALVTHEIARDDVAPGVAQSAIQS
jgi:4-amino-4-deoxy-L-arabinose transferase-like glycosyltransferase